MSTLTGGQFEGQQRLLALIVLLVYFAFGSVGQAALILINVPVAAVAAVAAVGGGFALFIFGQYLSVPSSVGSITLFGVAVLNGVVMGESINQRVSDGQAVSDAFF